MSARVFIATTGHGLARAQPQSGGTWKVEHLLEDQDLRCLAADPLSKGTVYAGTQGHGVWRSSDHGQTWQPWGLEGRMVKALAVSPKEPGVVYAGTKPPALFVSKDGGLNWTELEGFRRIPKWFWFSPAEQPFTAYVQAISPSPTDSKVILVGIEAGAVVRSADGGQTWNHHCPGALRDCHALVFHARDGNWVYEGGYGGMAWSQDAGKTFSRYRAGLDRFYGWAVAADPAQPEIRYLAVSPSAFKAHSEGKAEAYIFRAVGGAGWEKLSGGLPQPLSSMPYALLTDPNTPGHVYAGLGNGEVWKTSDHGEMWTRLPFKLRGIHRALVMV